MNCDTTRRLRTGWGTPASMLSGGGRAAARESDAFLGRPTNIGQEPRRTAMVVFVDRADCWWLRRLKPGFRHCFVALRHPPGWLVCDPLKNRIELTILDVPSSFDLPGFYLAQGHRVLLGRTAANRSEAEPRLGIELLTCVAVVKRVVGIRAGSVQTPWQLFRHLKRLADTETAWLEPASSFALT